MANAKRREVVWVTFCKQARIDSQSSGTMAVAASGNLKMYGPVDFDGVPHLVLEDPAFQQPGCIPWSNVASVGWAKS